MKKRIGIPVTTSGVTSIIEVGTNNDITNLFRPIMIQHAVSNNEALLFDETTGRAKRINRNELIEPVPQQEEIIVEQKDIDPVLHLINNAHKIKPESLEMSDIK